MVRESLRQFKRRWEHLNWGRDTVTALAAKYLTKTDSTPLEVLDVGPGEGFDLMNIRSRLQPVLVKLYGVECYDPYIEILRGKGVEVAKIDIEHDRFPFPDKTFDLVIANQIVEHTKEIFWIFSEVSRVIKPQGIVIVGVPNLASLHNRIMLLAGMQPSSIDLLGPHVRGITKNAFRGFITTDGYFDVLEIRGANFYPFPAVIANLLSKLFPTFSVSLFFCLQRTSKEGTFISVLDSRFLETKFFQGPDKG
jgi:SAM-dependent methyltransferase